MLLVRLTLADWLQERIPFYLPMVVAVIVAAWYGGLRPALLATALCVVLGTVFLDTDADQRNSPVFNRIRLAVFLAECLAIGGSFEAMHRARHRLERKQQQLEEEIRERQHAEQRLVTADRRKNEFLATLAHELRNPLAPIRYALEVLRVQADPALAADARAVVDRQIQQMVRLVDDLLDVSRISRNKLDLRREPVELSLVVQRAVETSRPLIEAGGQHLTVALPPEPIRLHADPVRLAQVFSNLLNNAAKYTERGGRIWLTTEQVGAEVVVTVRDNGIGIPDDMLPHIFEMFTQVEGALERSQGGLGIGLSLVKWLTEMHGGRIEVRSDGPGQGSEFSVHLPVPAAPTAPEESPPSGPADPPAQVRGYRVLVVDDNEDSVSSLRALLTGLGHTVQTAADGLEAVDEAAAFRPEVAILDLGMPKLNGYDAARLIRAQPGGDEIVLIAHTGWGQEEDRRRTQEAGFDYHLVKPVAPAAFERMLTDLQTARP
jgi:signal transduction histidine kinase